MIGEDYNEKSQKLKIKIEHFLQTEYKWIDERAKTIDNLLEDFGGSDSDMRAELLNLKKDNEDSLAIVSSLESMLKNRLSADGISRFTELVQGYDQFSNSITADLEKYFQ